MHAQVMMWTSIIICFANICVILEIFQTVTLYPALYLGYDCCSQLWYLQNLLPWKLWNP